MTDHSEIISGAAYYRVHTSGPCCQLHLTGFYTMADAVVVGSEQKARPGCDPCFHDAKLVAILEESNKKKREHLAQVLKVVDGKTADPDKQFGYDQPADVVSFYGLNDEQLHTIPWSTKKLNYDELSALLDPKARPIATSATIETCFKRGRICVLRGRLAGKQVSLACIRFTGAANLPFPQELRTEALSRRVDTSGIPADFVLEEALPRSTCTIM